MKNGKRAVFITPVKHSSAVRDDCCTRVRAVGVGGTDSSPCTIIQHSAYLLLRLRLHACVRVLISLHVCMNYLRVHLRLWAAGWVCSLKRLCFCCHFFLSPSLGSILTLRFSFSCGCIIHCPPLLVFHYPCLIVIDFKGQGKMMEECLIHTLPEPYAIEEGSW